MKKLILSFIISMALIAPAKAEMLSCDDIASLARTIMTKRQEGVRLTDLVANIESTNESREMKDAVIGLVVVAYEQPKYSTNEYITSAINEFESAVYMSCYKSRI